MRARCDNKTCLGSCDNSWQNGLDTVLLFDLATRVSRVRRTMQIPEMRPHWRFPMHKCVQARRGKDNADADADADPDALPRTDQERIAVVIRYVI